MIRSLFFAPANRHDLIAKFPRFQADCFILDLEDGTPESHKESARAGLGEAVRALRSGGFQARLLVRVNEPVSHHFQADLEAALNAETDGVCIPKYEHPDHLQPALRMISQAAGGRSRQQVFAGLESLRGIVDAVALAAVPGLSGVFFGAEDFAFELGARRTAAGTEVLYARSRVVLAAKAAGIVAIDQAVADIRDDEQYRRDAELGRDLGYDGKICLLPRQLAVCNAVFSPSAEEIAQAERMIQAYADATAAGIGTLDFEGRMIDGPLLKRAEAVLAMARRIAEQEGGRA